MSRFKHAVYLLSNTFTLTPNTTVVKAVVPYYFYMAAAQHSGIDQASADNKGTEKLEQGPAISVGCLQMIQEVS